jgi:hypothetical protein
MINVLNLFVVVNKSELKNVCDPIEYKVLSLPKTYGYESNIVCFPFINIIWLQAELG